MRIDAWVAAAIADAERRGLPELRPLIEALAQATRALRASDLPYQEQVRRPTLPPSPEASADRRSLAGDGSASAGVTGNSRPK
jgi:hypothetical protein